MTDLYYESIFDGPASCDIQHIHDFCMVRTPQASGDEDIYRLACIPGNPVFMGARLLRILRTGAGKPHRLLRQRRSVQHHAAESDSGSCFPDGLHDHRDVPFQGPAAPVEPPGSVRLPDIGCIFRLPEVNFQKNQKKYLDCKEI